MQQHLGRALDQLGDRGEGVVSDGHPPRLAPPARRRARAAPSRPRPTTSRSHGDVDARPVQVTHRRRDDDAADGGGERRAAQQPATTHQVHVPWCDGPARSGPATITIAASAVRCQASPVRSGCSPGSRTGTTRPSQRLADRVAGQQQRQRDDHDGQDAERARRRAGARRSRSERSTRRPAHGGPHGQQRHRSGRRTAASTSSMRGRSARRGQRGQRHPAGDQGQRRAHPGQRRPLVGQREARVRVAARRRTPSADGARRPLIARASVLVVAVRQPGLERRQADRDVLGARVADQVADPLARPGDQRLPGPDVRARRRRARRWTVPRSTRVTSSNSGVWAGSCQPGGACMCATETADSPLVTRPTYSSMTLPPGTGMRVGALDQLWHVSRA